MRMSCNGCRVLRKGCSEDCSIRPCLRWIKNPEYQGNATLFLAKFYGRAGLLNLINAGPIHLRPAIFRSLLYEACGRMVNPIYGALGLLWTGSWQLCQEAMDDVLKGRAITQIHADSAATLSGDIRHVCKDDLPFSVKEISKVSNNSRKIFKRSAKRRILSPPSSAMNSVETVEESLLEQRGGASEESDVELDLKLGFESVLHSHSSSSSSSHRLASEEPREMGGRIRLVGVEREDLGKDLGLRLSA